MRQKKLFLIVLWVIIVGVVVAVGINYFHNKEVKLNRSAVIKDLNTIASDAQEYYKKPNKRGGGEKSFQDYKIPQELKSNQNGSYKVISGKSDRLIIQGTGVETCEQNLSFNWGEIITYEIIIQPESTELRQVY
jgi:Tfp pilus assembly protein PilE